MLVEHGIKTESQLFCLNDASMRKFDTKENAPVRKLDTKVVSNPDAGEAAASADHLGPGTLEGRREQTSGPPSTGGKCLGALGSAGGASVGSDSSSSHRARGHGLLRLAGFRPCRHPH